MSNCLGVLSSFINLFLNFFNQGYHFLNFTQKGRYRISFVSIFQVRFVSNCFETIYDSCNKEKSYIRKMFYFSKWCQIITWIWFFCILCDMFWYCNAENPLNNKYINKNVKKKHYVNLYKNTRPKTYSGLTFKINAQIRKFERFGYL